MSLIEMMENRRSVRAFNSEPVTDEELNKILQAAMLAPNGKGLKPWSFVTIRDEKTLRDLVNCRKGGAKMLETATAAIAVYSDSDVTDTFIEDSSLVMGWMHLMASDLGLGSCWLQLRLRPSNEEGVSAEEFVNRRLAVFSPQRGLEKFAADIVGGEQILLNPPVEHPCKRNFILPRRLEHGQHATEKIIAGRCQTGP